MYSLFKLCRLIRRQSLALLLARPQVKEMASAGRKFLHITKAYKAILDEGHIAAFGFPD